MRWPRGGTWLALGSLAASALATAACIPSRDNAFDPSIAPAARLVIEDASDGHGGCLALGSALALAPVASVPHGDCLALDARLSRDAQGETLSYRFDWVSSGGTETLLQDFYPSPMVTVPGNFLRGLTVGRPQQFSVLERDSAGNEGSTSASVLPLNTRPSALVGPPRTFPLGGFPWAPGAPFSITFDGSASRDADGDPIVAYCWTLPDGTTTPCSTSPTVVFTASATSAGAFAAELVVKDPYDASAPVSANYHVGDPNLWLLHQTASGGQPLADQVRRLDQTYQMYPTPGTVQAMALRAAIGSAAPRLVVYDNGGGSVDLMSWPDFTLLSSVPAGDSHTSSPGDDGLTVDPGTGRIWTATVSYGTNGSVDLIPLDVISDSLQAGAPLPVVLGIDVNTGVTPFMPEMLTVDASHDLWMARFQKNVLLALTPSGQPLATFRIPAGTVFDGLAARPGSSEVWAMEAQDLLSSSAGTLSFSRFTRAPGGGVQETDYAVPSGGDAFGILWIEGGARFWTSLANRGICLVDVDRLALTGSFDNAVDTVVPVLSSLYGIADPVSGSSLWQTFFQSSAVEASPDGSYRTFPTGLLPQAIDPAGDLWSILSSPGPSAGPAVHSRALSADGTLFQASVSAFDVRADDTDGGLWLTNVVPKGIQKLAEDGTVVENLTYLQPVGGPQESMPEMVAVDRDPAGNLWAEGLLDNGGQVSIEVDRIDLAAPRSAPNVVPLITRSDISAFPTSLFEAVAVPPARLWFMKGLLFSSPIISLADSSGTITDKYTITDSGSAFGAVYPGSGNLCLVDGPTATITAPTTTIRQVPLTGAVILSTSYGLAGNVVGAGATTAAGQDACWLLGSLTGTSAGALLRAYDPTGKLLRSYSDALGPILSAKVVDFDHVFLLRQDPNSSGQAIPELLHFTGGTTELLPQASGGQGLFVR